MTTRAEAEATGDKDLLRAVANAEKASGFRTGVRFTGTQQHVVSVTFYPAVTWWIADIDRKSRSVGPKRALTQEEYAQTEGLKL